MPKVYGKIDSLKQIRDILDERGISSFNSIGDINRFIKHYDRHKEELFFNVEQDYILELDRLLEQKMALQQDYEIVKKQIETPLIQRINNLTEQCAAASSFESKNPVIEILYWYKYVILRAILFVYKKSFKRTIKSRTQAKLNKLKSFESSVNSFSLNRQRIISKRFKTKLQELEYKRKVVKDLYPLIAGALGENLVSKELQKISTTSVLFNDYSLYLSKPIFYKKEKQRIKSIQIDHLLVTNAGIFIIESKNWSKKSIKRLDLRSPVSQMQRASFALYVLLNGKDSEVDGYLNQHHWGTKEIPIRNIVAMINNKPLGKFRHVMIKKLEELNDYINYFDPIFDDSEVLSISEYLKRIKIDC